jgi:predicted glycosyltransferase
MSLLRALFYVNSSYGIGHFVRAARLIRGLQNDNVQVTAIAAGVPFPDFEKLAGCEVIWLPSLVFWGDTVQESFVCDPEKKKSIMVARERLLGEHISRRWFDFCVIDYYPFSKDELEPEVSYLLTLTQKTNRSIRRVCSIRDIIDRRANERSQQILKVLAAQFDIVVVHSDPGLFHLSESFARWQEIPCPLVHTGVVTNRPEATPERADGPVLVSVGGGRDGMLCLSVLTDALKLAGVRFDIRIFPGLFLPDGGHAIVRTLLSLSPRIRCNEFGEYKTFLPNAGGAIAMCGYNTCYELLSLRIPTLFVPRQRFEQITRSTRLAEMQLALCAAEDASMAAALDRLTSFQPAAADISYDGVRGFVEALKAL